MRPLTFEQQIQKRIRQNHSLPEAFAIIDAAAAKRNGHTNHAGAQAVIKHVGLQGPLTSEQQEQADKIRSSISYIVPLLSTVGAATVEYKSPRRDSRPIPHSAWEIDRWKFDHPKITHRRPWVEPATYNRTERLARLMLVDDNTLQVFSDVSPITIGKTDGGWSMKAEAGKPLSDFSLLTLAGRWAVNPDQNPADGFQAAAWESKLLELPLK